MQVYSPAYTKTERFSSSHGGIIADQLSLRFVNFLDSCFMSENNAKMPGILNQVTRHFDFRTLLINERKAPAILDFPSAADNSTDYSTTDETGQHCITQHASDLSVIHTVACIRKRLIKAVLFKLTRERLVIPCRRTRPERIKIPKRIFCRVIPPVLQVLSG